jgi:hypothetical protein
VVRRFIVPVAALALLMAAIFRVGIEKNMVGTFSGNDWGRYLFALGATLTKFRLGTGGYVIDSAIEGQLMLGGLNADPPTWPRLGAKYPDNWHDPELMQRALDRALHADIPPPTDDRLRGSQGDDVGLATFTALAFSLFGMKISSLYYTFFVLLGTSLLIFVITYRRSPVSLSCAILMLLALYTLCASDVVNLIQQVPPYRGGPGTEIKDAQVLRCPGRDPGSACSFGVASSRSPLLDDRLCCSGPASRDLGIRNPCPMAGLVGSPGIIGVRRDHHHRPARLA